MRWIGCARVSVCLVGGCIILLYTLPPAFLFMQFKEKHTESTKWCIFFWTRLTMTTQSQPLINAECTSVRLRSPPTLMTSSLGECTDVCGRRRETAACVDSIRQRGYSSHCENMTCFLITMSSFFSLSLSLSHFFLFLKQTHTR